MATVRRFILTIVLLLGLCAMAALARESSRSEDSKPLVLIGAIPLPNVVGRIDHLAFDGKGRLFVSALGNNTEEVIDLSAGTRVHTIAGIPKPQGVVYAPEFNKLFIGSDEGRLYIFDGSSFELITSINFGDDVDKRVYSVFREVDRDHYQLLTEVPSAVGARTAGYAVRAECAQKTGPQRPKASNRNVG